MPTPAPLRSTPDGRAHDVIDVINHLAEWLEPRRVTVEAADVVQALVEAATGPERGAQLARLNVPALRWVRENGAVIR